MFDAGRSCPIFCYQNSNLKLRSKLHARKIKSQNIRRSSSTTFFHNIYQRAAPTPSCHLQLQPPHQEAPSYVCARGQKAAHDYSCQWIEQMCRFPSQTSLPHHAHCQLLQHL